MKQMPLFAEPAQHRRFHRMADEIYERVIEMRKAGIEIRSAGRHIVVGNRRLTLREFRDAFNIRASQTSST